VAIQVTQAGLNAANGINNWYIPCNEHNEFNLNRLPVIHYATVAITRDLNIGAAHYKADFGLTDHLDEEFDGEVAERLVVANRYLHDIDGPKFSTFLMNGDRVTHEWSSPMYAGVVDSMLKSSRLAADRGACVSLGHRIAIMIQNNMLPEITLTQQFDRFVSFRNQEVGETFRQWCGVAQKILQCSIPELNNTRTTMWRETVGQAWGLSHNLGGALRNEAVAAVPAMLSTQSAEIFRQILAAASASLRLLWKPSVHFFAWGRKR